MRKPRALYKHLTCGMRAQKKRMRISMGSYNTGERTLKPKSLAAVTILEREQLDLGNTPLRMTPKGSIKRSQEM